MKMTCPRLLGALIMLMVPRYLSQDTNTPNSNIVDRFDPNLPAGCVTRDRHLGWQSRGERGMSMRSCESAIRTMANAERERWDDNFVFVGRGGGITRDSVQTPIGYVAGKLAQTHAACPTAFRSSPR